MIAAHRTLRPDENPMDIIQEFFKFSHEADNVSKGGNNNGGGAGSKKSSTQMIADTATVQSAADSQNKGISMYAGGRNNKSNMTTDVLQV